MLFHSGEVTNASSDYYEPGLQYLNRVYQEICSGGSAVDTDCGRPWWWLRKSTPGVITLQPGITSLKATINAGSTELTWDVAPTDWLGNKISVVGYFFYVDSDNGDIYRITTHTAAQNVALIDQPYTGASQVASACHLIKFQYSLASDCKSIVGRMRAYQDNRDFIDMTDLDPMRTQFPLRTRPTGMPILFAMVGEQTVEFSHYIGDTVTSGARVEYDYLVIPNDLADDGVSQPLLPFQYRAMLSDYGTAFILTDKDDNKAATFLASAQGRLQAMVKEHDRRMSQASNNFGKIMPRQRDLRRYDAPLRTQSGLIIG
jgi:hypothetical protein